MRLHGRPKPRAGPPTPRAGPSGNAKPILGVGLPPGCPPCGLTRTVGSGLCHRGGRLTGCILTSSRILLHHGSRKRGGVFSALLATRARRGAQRLAPSHPWRASPPKLKTTVLRALLVMGTFTSTSSVLAPRCDRRPFGAFPGLPSWPSHRRPHAPVGWEGVVHGRTLPVVQEEAPCSPHVDPNFPAHSCRPRVRPTRAPGPVCSRVSRPL